jgi:hypothetical protein
MFTRMKSRYGYDYLPKKANASISFEGEKTEYDLATMVAKKPRKRPTPKAAASTVASDCDPSDPSNQQASYEFQYQTEPVSHEEEDSHDDVHDGDEGLQRDVPSVDDTNSRRALTNQYFQNYSSNVESVLSKESRAKGVLQDLAWLQSDMPGCRSIATRRADVVSVGIVTWDNFLEIQVPVMLCITCEIRLNIHPTQINCLPTSLREASPLVRHANRHPLWWATSLPQQFDLLIFHLRLVGAERFSAAMLENWTCNGGLDSAPPHTSLRKGLYLALQEYQILQNKVLDLPEDLVEHCPKGSLNGCPCCHVSPTLTGNSC